MIGIPIPYEQLCDVELFNNAKIDSKIEYICPNCQQTYNTTKRIFLSSLRRSIKRGIHTTPFKYCSTKCVQAFLFQAGNCFLTTNCTQCNIPIKRYNSALKVSRSGNLFCSQSCSATYNSTHRTTGIRRSKLEMWLESKLPILYPNLEFQFNHKDAITAELDIYILRLQLAFELNGIFHYKPIHGKETLTRIQNNDNRKLQVCLEKGIELHIINTMSQRKCNDVSSARYLETITGIINSKNVLHV